MELPYYRTIIMNRKEPFISNLVQQLQKHHDVVVLQSQMNEHPASKRTFIASKSNHSISIWGNKIEICEGKTIHSYFGDALVALQDFRKKHKDWLFGYLGYDLKNDIETLHSKNKELSSIPDMWFFVPEFLIEIDEETGNFATIKGELPVDLRRSILEIPFKLQATHQISKEIYIEQIKAAQNLIKEGEFYEINISHALEYSFEGEAWDLFERMRKINPVPFAAYIKKENLSVCCASPERFIQKKGDKLKSQPIKGTISRGLEDDGKKIDELRTSEKERAENLMIVDLVRNDLSKIAKHGSVNVSDLFEIQSFGTVHQMVSTVDATIKEGVEIEDILRATFPMGSMTGAPKVAAMKAIEELENYKRGLYSGAIGYITPENDFDFNVVIRTAIIQNQQLIFPVGGAITSDSDPLKEWEETLVKAKTITKIIE